MLNEGKRTELLFFLREIVLEAGVSDKLAEPFMASLVAKGARESVDNARRRYFYFRDTELLRLHSQVEQGHHLSDNL